MLNDDRIYLDEYRKLYRGLRQWVKQGRKGKSRAMRELLRDYVLILQIQAFGMALRLRISAGNTSSFKKMVTHFFDVGKGQDRRRELIARHGCVRYLKRIHRDV